MKPSQRRNPTYLTTLQEREQLNGHFRRLWTQTSKVDNKTPRSFYSNPTSVHYRGGASSTRLRHAPRRSQSMEPLQPANASNFRQPVTPSTPPTTASAVHWKHLHHSCTPSGSSLSLHRRTGNKTSQLSSAAEIPNGSWRQEARHLNGDLLDTAFYQFAQPTRPFAPRTLLTNFAESRLAKSRNYQPPLSRRRLLKNSSSAHNIGSADAVPLVGSSSQTKVSVTTGDYDTATVKGLRFERKEQRLDDSFNTASLPPMDSSRRSAFTPEPSQEHHLTSSSLQRRRLSPNILGVKPVRNHAGGSRVSSKISNEEQDEKYFHFVHDVTRDIVERGVYSERVLKNTIANHMERRKNELNTTRMRLLVSKLLSDLGVSQDGLLSVYLERAAHPEDHLHVDLNDVGAGVHAAAHASNKKLWNPGNYKALEEETEVRRHEFSDTTSDADVRHIGRTPSSKNVANIRNKAHSGSAEPELTTMKQRQPTSNSKPLVTQNDDVSLDLSDADIDAILEGKNLHDILHKNKEKLSGKKNSKATDAAPVEMKLNLDDVHAADEKVDDDSAASSGNEDTLNNQLSDLEEDVARSHRDTSARSDHSQKEDAGVSEHSSGRSSSRHDDKSQIGDAIPVSAAPVVDDEQSSTSSKVSSSSISDGSQATSHKHKTKDHSRYESPVHGPSPASRRDDDEDDESAGDSSSTDDPFQLDAKPPSDLGQSSESSSAIKLAARQATLDLDSSEHELDNNGDNSGVKEDIDGDVEAVPSSPRAESPVVTSADEEVVEEDASGVDKAEEQQQQHQNAGSTHLPTAAEDVRQKREDFLRRFQTEQQRKRDEEEQEKLKRQQSGRPSNVDGDVEKDHDLQADRNGAQVQMDMAGDKKEIIPNVELPEDGIASLPEEDQHDQDAGGLSPIAEASETPFQSQNSTVLEAVLKDGLGTK